MEVAQVNRTSLGQHIANRLRANQEQLYKQYRESSKKIGYFFVDDLLPETLVHAINTVFPTAEEMTLKKSLKEHKSVAAQMNRYDALLEEVIFAFQEQPVVEAISAITQITGLEPDDNLYAGGLSSMSQGQFLNPHLDNSHDKDRDRWRVLNLLYYVSPNWQLEYGGNLEIWPDGMAGDAVTIESRYNRLAIMATHQESWHSVSPVVHNGSRNCVSNYYFSKQPLRPDDRFHVTSFRGRPDQPVVDKILQVDNALRMGVRKVFKKGIVENKHVYKHESEANSDD